MSSLVPCSCSRFQSSETSHPFSEAIRHAKETVTSNLVLGFGDLPCQSISAETHIINNCPRRTIHRNHLLNYPLNDPIMTTHFPNSPRYSPRSPCGVFSPLHPTMNPLHPTMNPLHLVGRMQDYLTMEKLDEFGLIPGFDPVPWYPNHDSIYEDNTSMDEYANHLKTRLHDAHDELGMVLTELRSNRLLIDETTTSIHKIGEELDELNGFISTLNKNKDLIPVEDFNVYSVTQFTNNILSKRI